MEQLNINNFKVLNIIKILDKNSYFPLSGYLYYTRKLTRRYNGNENDFLDNIIINSIKDIYPESFAINSINIYFKDQLEETIDHLGGEKSELDFNIHFIPKISLDEMYELSNYNLKFSNLKLNFIRTFPFDKENSLYINNNIQAYIPLDKWNGFETLKETFLS